MNNGAFDGGLLSGKEKSLHQFYKTLLWFSANSSALTGSYRGNHQYNRKNTPGYNDHLFSFVRWKGADRLIVLCNFDTNKGHTLQLKLDPKMIDEWNLIEGTYSLTDVLTNVHNYHLKITHEGAFISYNFV